MSPSRGRVVVIGSGAAGATAALSAAAAGAPVNLLEVAPSLGGTTAISGGGTWIPANPWAAARGVQDSPQEALEYLRGLDLGDVDPRLIECYISESVRAARGVEEQSAVRWQPLVGWPDYHVEIPGGSECRSLEIAPTAVPPEWIARVRADPYGAPPATITEERDSDALDADEVERRQRAGIVTRGRGLVAALAAALHEHGGTVHTGVRVTRLLRSGDAVVGVEAAGRTFDGEVIVASGGFERSPDLVRAFLRGPLEAPAGPPSNQGDGLRMGMAAGAALGNMSEAWWSGAMHVPGETVDGAPFYRMLFLDFARPGGVVVDRRGRRFVNEASNYNDLGRALHDFDAGRFEWIRTPSWLIFDATRRAAPLGPLRGADPDPAWLVTAPSLDALASRIDLPAQTLTQTVERFNEHARAGDDPDFGRGSFAFDAFSAKGPTLGPLAEPPFYALRVLPGCLGTKGGLRIDQHGRVLHALTGDPIPGLYAAGNAAANPFGCAYPGPGATVGPGVVFGWLAGETAARSAS